MSIEELVKEDSSFNETRFIANVDNTYIMLLSAIMTNNIDRVKHKIGKELEEKIETILNDLNEKNLKQMYGEPNVKSTRIISVDMDDEYYTIEVELVSRYLDYLINKETHEFVSGNKESRVELKNHLTFKKRRNSKAFDIIKKCPTCGASIDYNRDGKCPYCHNIFNTEDYDYILVDMTN